MFGVVTSRSNVREVGLKMRRSTSIQHATHRARCLLSSMLVALGMLGLVGGVAARAEAGAVQVVQGRGVVSPTLADFLGRAIDAAERDGATALVIEMDTPGGLDSSMRQIVQRILATRVPVILYVTPSGARAGSAGVYITYAAHVAVMAPNTNIGSATPVAMGENGEAKMSDEMRAKVTNDASAYLRGLAERRGRNAEWAERAVREGANVTEQEALRLGVVDVVAADLTDLLVRVDGRTVETSVGPVRLETAGAPVHRLEMGAVDTFFQAIANPTIAYLLLSLGSLGLFFELSNPGSILPGVVGGICLLLGFYALGTLPVNYAGLGLMGFALVLFAADLFAPSHGILTAGGVTAFVLGSLLLFNVPEAGPWLRVSLWVIAAVSVAMALFFGGMIALATRGQRRKVVTGREGLVGQVGSARTVLDPNGMVFVDGALWEAVAERGPILRGERVVVDAVDGLLLRVHPAPDVGMTEPDGRELAR